MTETEKKKDRFLCCGYKGITRVERFWEYTGRELLLKSWMIVSPFALIVLLWADLSGYIAPESAIAKILAIVLYLVLIIGAAVDIIYAGFEAKSFWDWHELTTLKKITQNLSYWGKRAITIAFETVSPVYMVWVASAWSSGELAAISRDVIFLLVCAAIFGAVGCVYDAIKLFGHIITGIWQNRDSNFIGTGKRTVIRGFGVAVYCSGMCR